MEKYTSDPSTRKPDLQCDFCLQRDCVVFIDHLDTLETYCEKCRAFELTFKEDDWLE